MRIYICDDEPLMIEKLQRYLQLYFDSNHLKSPQFISYTSGESLLSDPYIKDIVFLDIEMSGMNGIYVGKELKKQNKNCIIFVVTSYSEYLDEAMRFHVFRYLSKPLDKQRLYRNFHDALVYYSTLTTQIAVETKDSVCTTSKRNTFSEYCKIHNIILLFLLFSVFTIFTFTILLF